MERIVTKWGRSWRKTRRKLSRVLVRSEPLPTDGCTGVGRLTCYQSNELGTDFLGSWVLWFVWKFALWAKPEDIWFGTAVETFPCLGSWASQFLSSNSPWEFNLSVSHPSPGSRFPGGDPPQSRHQGTTGVKSTTGVKNILQNKRFSGLWVSFGLGANLPTSALCLAIHRSLDFLNLS